LRLSPPQVLRPQFIRRGIDMKKLLTFIFILCTVTLFAEMRGGAPYDPGAARSNLSNVDATATPSMTSITLSDKVKAAWADILGDIYASGTVKVSTGTAAAPTYSFASDPNTGMYSPAADTVGVSVAGAEALRVNSAGEVLVAASTDAGDYKLQVNGNAYVNGNVLVGTTIDDSTSKLRVNGRIYNSFLDATSTQRVYKSDALLVMAANDVIPINSALSSEIPSGKRVGRIDATECNGGYITSYALRGGTNTAVEGFDPANIFSPTFDNANTINICYSATEANYVIQNKTASTIRLHISYIGQ
jgi:hypothetical protein